MKYTELATYYRGKRVFVTGHTGFKGTWLCKILLMMGAEVYGYSLKPPTKPSIYEMLDLDNEMKSTIGDIRDNESLCKAMENAQPEIVFHLAAQPIVRESYRIPRETYETNVMGTVNILESVRSIPSIKSVLNVTTDKVYENNDLEGHAFVEDEKLDGYDPYSNSKSCSELVTHAYTKSFFYSEQSPAISTARAGNVIGGGDFALDRIIPDCVRATVVNKPISIRNPYSTRPYQHVFEPLCAYLIIAMKQERDKAYSGCYNVGPDEIDCLTTGDLADLFVKYWGDNASWLNMAEKNAPHEANYLKLECKKIRTQLGWTPQWHAEQTVEKTVQWYKAWNAKDDIIQFSERQIRDFFGIEE